MNEPILGIDLGTTNSVVAVAEQNGIRVLADEEGRKLLPSVVSFHPSGDVLVGYSARERRLLDARNTIYSVKRLIGRPYRSEEVERAKTRFAFQFVEGPNGSVQIEARGEQYAIPEISAVVLRQLQHIAERAVGEPLLRAVVTVPASFNELQRSATIAAGKIAGLDVVRIINEPTAAALAYGFTRGSRERIAVYDLGGGTFDLTILQLSGDVFEVLATAGDTFLGGDDVDFVVAEEMADVFLAQHRVDLRADSQAFERLKAAAEWAKCQLSFKDEVQLTIEELAYSNGGTALDLEFTLSRARLDELMRPIVARSFDVCEEAMRIAAVRPEHLDCVILVGGSTRSPLVREMVADYFQRDPLTHVDPDLVVAQGAAIQGFVLSGGASAAVSAPKIAKIAVQKMISARPSDVVEVMAKRNDPRSDDGDEEDLPLLDLEDDDAEPTASFTRKSLIPTAAHEHVEDDASDLPLDLDMPTGANEGIRESVRVAGQVIVGDAPAPDMADARPRRHAPAPARIPLARPLVVEGASTLSGMAVVPEQVFGDYTTLDEHDIIHEDLLVPEAGLDVSRAPLLLDVTPHSFCIETTGGFCEKIILRNSAVPAERKKIFSTSGENQSEVVVVISQGESRNISQNQNLGTIALRELRAAPRGELQIEVEFALNADGVLGVRACDLETGKAAEARVELIGSLSQAEIESMSDRRARRSVRPKAF